MTINSDSEPTENCPFKSGYMENGYCIGDRCRFFNDSEETCGFDLILKKVIIGEK